jgi:hypothetical protein
LIGELAAVYGEFLDQVQRDEDVVLAEFAEPDNRKKALEHATRYGDLIYALLEEASLPERMRYLVI